MKGRLKHDESKRREIASRYWLGVRNRAKQLCAEYRIHKDTLRKYVREFQV